jgi:hypothetical protein
VKSLIGNKNSTLPSCASDQVLADPFADYFQEKVHKLQEDFKDISTVPMFNSQFECVSIEDIMKLVSKASNKSCDLDSLPTSLAKQYIDDKLGVVIHNIISKSLKEETVPNCFKKIMIRPLLQGSSLDFNSLSNYRPISNIQFISKILEKVVATRLVDHMNKNGLHDENQSGYKMGHSTETLLIKINNDINMAFDRFEGVFWSCWICLQLLIYCPMTCY